MLRWIFSKSVRESYELLKRIEKHLRAQDDILTVVNRQKIETAIIEFKQVLKDGKSTKNSITSARKELSLVADKYFKIYPNPDVRENVDVALVALIVALAIRTFFLQPMAIPTGSMQPTLYGITHQDLRGTEATYPSILGKVFKFLVKGESYYHIVAEEDGNFEGAGEPKQFFPFINRQQFKVGSKIHTVWMPPDGLFAPPYNRSGLTVGQKFKKGDDIIKLKVTSGDRLFVDRVAYNVRSPARGDIIIFESTGIPNITQNTHYIKRLIGLSGETIQVGDDRHVVIDGKRLDASTPHFENIYSFKAPPKEDLFSGHVNDKVGRQFGRPEIPHYAPHFVDGNAKFTIRTNHLFVCGDNTMSSYDSRYWGDFPREKAVGRHAFVFWPITERFGWGVR